MEQTKETKETLVTLLLWIVTIICVLFLSAMGIVLALTVYLMPYIILGIMSYCIAEVLEYSFYKVFLVSMGAYFISLAVDYVVTNYRMSK